MPIYDFECSNCRTITEKLVKVGVDYIDCPNCNAQATRKLASTGISFRLTGDGWYKPSASDGTTN